MQTLIGFLIGIATVGVIYYGYTALDRHMTPQYISPIIVVVDNGDGEILRYSYIPHWSIFRSARSWYDRKIERYVVQKDTFILKSCSLYEYHYPLLELGDRSVLLKDCEIE